MLKIKHPFLIMGDFNAQNENILKDLADFHDWIIV